MLSKQLFSLLGFGSGLGLRVKVRDRCRWPLRRL